MPWKCYNEGCISYLKFTGNNCVTKREPCSMAVLKSPSEQSKGTEAIMLLLSSESFSSDDLRRVKELFS